MSKYEVLECMAIVDIFNEMLRISPKLTISSLGLKYNQDKNDPLHSYFSLINNLFLSFNNTKNILKNDIKKVYPYLKSAQKFNMTYSTIEVNKIVEILTEFNKLRATRDTKGVKLFKENIYKRGISKDHFNVLTATYDAFKGHISGKIQSNF